MADAQEPKQSGFFTPFRLIFLLWLVLLTGVVAVVIINLLQAQSAVQATLSQAAHDVTALADDRLEYTVQINQTVPISTIVVINEEIPVPVSLEVNHTITVDNTIPFQQEIEVPVNLEIDEVFAVDTTVPFKDDITVPINQVIAIDEEFGIPIQIPGANEYIIYIPVQGDIPVKLDVQVPIDRNIPVKADIPVNIPISKTLTVEVDKQVPVNLEIPVNIPVETEVTVPISRTIPIDIEVPIVMDIPIDIAISDTPFGDYLRELGESLQRMSNDLN